jgi:hypothetical protein
MIFTEYLFRAIELEKKQWVTNDCLLFKSPWFYFINIPLRIRK